jgi:hypothetical protein
VYQLPCIACPSAGNVDKHLKSVYALSQSWPIAFSRRYCETAQKSKASIDITNITLLNSHPTTPTTTPQDG